MLAEYTKSDSVFLTSWYANGTIRTPRAFQGLYSIRNDSVLFYDDIKCGPQDTGIYTFRYDSLCARDRVIFTLVNDPCGGRIMWFNSFGNSQYPCSEWIDPMTNTCWVVFNQFTQEYVVKEFTSNNEVYETEYDHTGTITKPRHQNGWYYNNNYDTIIFVDAAGTTCGADSGIYVVGVTCINLQFTLISDPCPSRISNIIGSYNRLICDTVDIGLKEEATGSKYQFYPNPAVNNIIVEPAEGTFNKNAQIVLFDLMGNELLTRAPRQFDNSCRIDIKDFSSGVYILIVYENNLRILSQRITIQK